MCSTHSLGRGSPAAYEARGLISSLNKVICVSTDTFKNPVAALMRHLEIKKNKNTMYKYNEFASKELWINLLLMLGAEALAGDQMDQRPIIQVDVWGPVSAGDRSQRRQIISGVNPTHKYLPEIKRSPLVSVLSVRGVSSSAAFRSQISPSCVQIRLQSGLHLKWPL